MSAREVVQAALDRIDRSTARSAPSSRSTARRRWPRRRRSTSASPAARTSGRWPASRIGGQGPRGRRRLRTTQGSAAYADGPPASSDSPLVERLRAAGCVVVGKTNTPELGWKADTVNPCSAPPATRGTLERTAGGSSGGSAAALAAGLVPLAPDPTAGARSASRRRCAGLSGMKPSLGRVPIGGPKPPGWADLSTRGLMARRDPRRHAGARQRRRARARPTCARCPCPTRSWSRSLASCTPPRKVGWSPTLGYAQVDPRSWPSARRRWPGSRRWAPRSSTSIRCSTSDPVQTGWRWPWRVHARSLGHLRGTDDWEPHRSRARRAAGARAPTSPAPT